MPRLILPALFVCLTLAACGADGEPTPPAQPGITITGEAQIGVAIK